MSKVKGLLARLAKALVEMGNVTTDKGILSWDGEEDLKAGDSVYVEDQEGNRTPAADGDYTTGDGKVIVVVDGKVAEIKDGAAEVAPQQEPAAAEEEAPAAKMVQTDKGKLEWDGEDEDLKEGDAVYITDAEGNRNPAPDGDYTTEDGKIISVVDGKVASITDPKAEVSEEGSEAAEAMAAIRSENEALSAQVAELRAEKAALQAQVADLTAQVEALKKAPAASPAHEEFNAGSAPSTGNKRMDRLSRIMGAK